MTMAAHWEYVGKICKYIYLSQEMSVLVAAQPESFTPDLT